MVDFLISSLSHVLVPIFAIGMVGSGIVVAITLVHDIRDFFTDDDATVGAADSLK